MAIKFYSYLVKMKREKKEEKKLKTIKMCERER